MAESKIPIWIKDRETNSYELIPYDKMDVFPDGTKGFYSYNWLLSTLAHDAGTYDFIKRHKEYFRWDESHEQAKWVWQGQPQIIDSSAWTGR